MSEKEKGMQKGLQVERHEKDLVLIPQKGGSRRALEALVAMVKHDEQLVKFVETLEASPPDGAIAMHKALNEVIGAMVAQDIMVNTPFGKIKVSSPMEIEVQDSPHTTVHVPWGEFTSSSLEDGKITYGGQARPDGTVVFVASFEVKRYFEQPIREAVQRAREILRTASIYRGKALEVTFRDHEGQMLPMPEIKFLDLSKELPLIFDLEVMQDFTEQVLWPIEAYGQKGIPEAPCGVLFSGIPGTGKSQAFHVIGRAAIQNGHWTVIHCKDPRDFVKAISLARQYQPAIMITEDIDQVVTKERDQLTNEILDALSGVRQKNTQVTTLVSTNNYNKLPDAFIRTGRFDTTFFLAPPRTPHAMAELLRAYSDNLIPETEDLKQPAARLVALNMIPSDIAEVVRRVKRSASFRLRGKPTEILARDFGPAISALEREREQKAEAMKFTKIPTEGEHIKEGLVTLAGAVKNQRRPSLLEIMEGGVDETEQHPWDDEREVSHLLGEDELKLLRQGGEAS